jgi:type I restriction enzyme M protein
MLDNKLKSDIQKLWNRFWTGGISNPITAIEQISYLIFLKRLEDEDNKNEMNAKLTGNEFKSLFEGDFELGDNNKFDKATCKWSHWSNFKADDALIHVQNRVFPFLKSLGETDSFYARYMTNAVFTIPTGSLLIEAVNIINDMHIKDQNRDTQGDIYEYLLNELQTAGKNGQFRTPRHIIKMITSIVNPQVGDLICDPACGTTGFLVSAYEQILEQNTSAELIKIDEDGTKYNFKADKLSKSDWNFLKTDAFNGYDLDPTMARIGVMNLMMHGIDNPHIEQLNTLSQNYAQSSKYDIILANPPFKGSIDESELSDKFGISSKKTELLFLELIYNVLVKGGKAGVIIPEGVLFGNSNAHKAVRELLLTKCRLDAVVKMPSGVFKPYAGVSTGVLFFTKGEPTKEVLFYEMESDGFSLDDKRNKLGGKGDISDIIEKISLIGKSDFSDRTKKCFSVPFEEIKSNDFNLSMNTYKEDIIEEIEYEDSKVIKAKILELEKSIISTLEKLE